MNIEDPLALMFETSKLFKENNIPCSLYGGMALAVYGNPRETRDVDFVSSTLTVPGAINILKERFPDSLDNFKEMTFGGVKISRVTLIADDINDNGFNCTDFITPADEDYAERVIERSVIGELGSSELTVVSPEDYVIIKAISTRAIDIQDAVSVLDNKDININLGLISDELNYLAKQHPIHNIEERWQSIKSKSTRFKESPGTHP